MTSRTLALMLALVLLTGCKSLELGPEWRPLTQIQESTLMTPGLSYYGARTVGSTIYVRDLNKWLELTPEPKYTGILKHEQVHAIRQKEIGLGEFIGKYLSDAKFMWEEEQRGWYVEIKHRRANGMRVDPRRLAKSLHKYKNTEGPMVSEEEAEKWIRDVMSGRWTPPE